MEERSVYDYIVVGGGSSGCVAASRLITDHGARVLLLEAGPGNKNLLISMPAGTFKINLGNTPYLKRYTSEPQPQLGGKTVPIAQASVLGGGSSVNVMAYVRGSKADYDRWTEATGGFPWGWEQLLPIFKRQEGNRRFDNAQHGGSGPFKVGDPISPPASSEIFVRTMQRLGLPYRDDFNAGDLTGVGFLQTSIHKSKRCSSANAFIDPIMDDPRLTVLTLAEVRSVRFKGTRAIGVDYLHRGKPCYAEANSEIILTAGSLETPKLLMLSGIGPRDHLKSLGIDCIADSPGVGENLQDHCVTFLTLATKGAYGFFGEDTGLRAAVNMFRYTMFGDGPIASNGADVMAFTNLSDPSAEPDLQFYCIPVLWPPYAGGPITHGLTLMANLVRPRSRGRVRLRSAEPRDNVLIDFNWLSDPDDARRMLEAIKYLRKISETEPFASIVAAERMPGSRVQSDALLMKHVHDCVETNYHPVGTCKMGADNDPHAVLTPDLRVRGVERLRVFDASVMPDIISANTNATAMVIAERGVELMIK